MSAADSSAVTIDGATVRAELLLRNVTAQNALAAFTDPDVVRDWWGAELTTGAHGPITGGEYLARFPALGQTMIGVVEEYVPCVTLAFTWGWSHQPEQAGHYGVRVSVAEVTEVAESADVPDAVDGVEGVDAEATDLPFADAATESPSPTTRLVTRLVLEHAPRTGYVVDPHDPAPAEHAAGWLHFLPRLADALHATA